MKDNTPDYIQDIKDFHEKYGMGYAGPPRTLPDDMDTFRTEFLYEEVDEYSHGKATLEDKFDALIDLVYIALGNVYQHGLADRFAEGWQRVHAANMLKVRVQSATDSARGSKYDVVKPPGWRKPVLGDLVER